MAQAVMQVLMHNAAHTAPCELEWWFAAAGCSVWLEDPTAYENPDAWVVGWTRLAAAISKVGSKLRRLLTRQR
jgi:hypothetical protein